jgi:hypothetical protein
MLQLSGFVYEEGHPDGFRKREEVIQHLD